MMQTDHTSTLLGELPAFRPISTSLRGEIANNLRVEPVCRNAPVCLDLPTGNHYLLPLSGNLTLHHVGDAFFGMLLPVGVLWPVVLNPGKAVEVRSNSPGYLGILSSESVGRLMSLSAETRIAILQSICQSDNYLTTQLEQYACNDLSGRVAQLLLELQRGSEDGMIHYAHSQLAGLLNAQRESVSVIIGRFRRAGWLATSYGRIELLQPNALRQVSQSY